MGSPRKDVAPLELHREAQPAKPRDPVRPQAPWVAALFATVARNRSAPLAAPIDSLVVLPAAGSGLHHLQLGGKHQPLPEVARRAVMLQHLVGRVLHEEAMLG